MSGTDHKWGPRARAYLAAGLVACVTAGVLTAWADSTSGHLIHAAVLLLTCLTLCSAAFGVVRLRFTWLTTLLLIPAGVATAQLIMRQTASPFETIQASTQWLARAGIFFIAVTVFRCDRRRKLFQEGVVWFGAGMAILALLEWYTAEGKILWIIPTAYTSEIAATFLNRDHYSVLMELLLPFAIVRAISAQRSALLYAACAGLMFSSVVVCASRAGTVIVTLEVVILLAILCRGQGGTYGRAALLIASLLAFVILGGWQFVWERFHLQDPFAYRREMLLATIDMIRSKPWTGYGLGTWPSIYPQFALFDPPGIYMNHAHNDWAEWAAEGGVALSAVLSLFCAALLWRVRRLPWALGLSAFCLHAVVDFPFQKTSLALTFFAIAGIALAATRQSASNRDPQSQRS